MLHREKEREKRNLSRRGLARDMRLSRNRGNARGPTRLTNPLRLRAMSCSARVCPSCHQTLPYDILFSSFSPFPDSQREHPSSSLSLSLSFSRSLGLSAIPPTFSPFAVSLPTCPPLFPPLRPPFTLRFLRSPARRILFAFPSSTIHPPPYSSSATPSSLLFPRLLFHLCPPPYVLRSPPLAPIVGVRGTSSSRFLAFFIVIVVSLSSSSSSSLRANHAHLRQSGFSYHLCYRIIVRKYSFFPLSHEILSEIDRIR